MCKEATVTVPQRSDPTRFRHASSLPKPSSTKTATGSPEATSGCTVRGGNAVKKMSFMGGRVQPQKHKDLSLIPSTHRRMWDVVRLAGWWREVVLTGHPVWWGNGYRGTAFDCPLASLYTHIYMHLKTRTLHMISQNPHGLSQVLVTRPGRYSKWLSLQYQFGTIYYYMPQNVTPPDTQCRTSYIFSSDW